LEIDFHLETLYADVTIPDGPAVLLQAYMPNPGEVLQGAGTDRDFKLLREYLGSQAFYDLKDGRESAVRAAKMSIELRRKGMAIKSTIDLLIAQTAIDNDLYLLHNDSDFDRIKTVSPLKTWE